MDVPCPVHPARSATAACSHCGRFVCGECFTQVDGRSVCTTCVTEGRVRSGRPVPWEHRASLGWAAALWQTVVEASLRPRELFRGMKEDGSLGEAMGFALLANLPQGMALGMLYAVAVLTVGFLVPGVAEEFGGDEGPLFLAVLVVVFALSGLMIPVFLVIAALLFGLLHHGLLSLMGAARAPLVTTLRVAQYAAGVQFWGVIVCLQFAYVPLVWSMISTGVGYQEVHRSPGWKLALAIVLPYLTCCGAYVAFYAALFAAGELR